MNLLSRQRKSKARPFLFRFLVKAENVSLRQRKHCRAQEKSKKEKTVIVLKFLMTAMLLTFSRSDISFHQCLFLIVNFVPKGGSALNQTLSKNFKTVCVITEIHRYKKLRDIGMMQKGLPLLAIFDMVYNFYFPS